MLPVDYKSHTSRIESPGYDLVTRELPAGCLWSAPSHIQTLGEQRASLLGTLSRLSRRVIDLRHLSREQTTHGYGLVSTCRSQSTVDFARSLKWSLEQT